jgi:hypothetical protein
MPKRNSATAGWPRTTTARRVVHCLIGVLLAFVIALFTVTWFTDFTTPIGAAAAAAGVVKA